MTDITKRYGDMTAVDNLSFAVPAGSILGFLGPNGAGKTTTLRMVLDIVRPSAGEIAVFGEPLSRLMLHRIGFLPEERGLYKRMTVLDSVVYFGRLKGMRRADADREARRLLEQIGLGARLGQTIDALSKGLAQKVQLAAALVNSPRLVLLDEPFSGLDPVNQSVLEEIIVDLARDGATVIFSTHIMQHAERLCDRLLLLAAGRKVFEGTPDEAQLLVAGRVRMVARGDPSGLDGVQAATRVSSAEAWHEWNVEIAPGHMPGEILQACFHEGLELKDFEPFRPRLHDIFVHLVGSGGEEPR